MRGVPAGPESGSAGETSPNGVATDGTWDESIEVSVEIDGDNSLLTYDSPSAHEIGGQLQVTYHWDRASSEAVADPEDRTDI